MDGGERSENDPTTITRRTAIGSTAGLAAAFVLVDGDAVQAKVSIPPSGATLAITPIVNGRATPVTIDPRTSLLDLLREKLKLTGAKKGCDHGQCGACTVHINSRRVVSCLTLAAKTNGQAVTTIEGLAEGERLHPMQQAFIDHDALQCGYCTPGQIMAAVACIREGKATSRATIREAMSGNICRCGAYVGIVDAIEDVAGKGRRV
ncbi:hypothetical protein ASG11_05120 [Sphingomonas sp. Leaf357]|uniref:(2Fe-2S)-binding protein n=1 Tax=Sphingomonas sp. Leaf357 TaxID=1736350 RepID=UPI0006F9CD14|nr:(2Fe-2S)-binding protein [Sphingomonas sp. Leaf357]KQS03700.1 hypothetical protein ASG11_05120 [Sphingomonas sp. Leaf357]